MADPLDTDTGLAAEGVQPIGVPGIDSPWAGPAATATASMLASPMPGAAIPREWPGEGTTTTRTTGGGATGSRQAAVALARDLASQGIPYKWGGTTTAGFDCSGFTAYVLAKAGMSLPRVSFQQAGAGRRVGIGDLRPGDLVAWDNSSRNNGADHIAIYLGDGLIAEAPRAGLNVRIRSLGRNEGAWGVALDY